MSNISEINVPTMYNSFPKRPRDYPISERENIMRALNHEKPLWMPNLSAGSQLAPAGPNGDQPDFSSGNKEKSEQVRDYTDWFGTEYKYSDAAGSATPVSTVLSDVTKWKEEVVWPDLDKLDWKAGSEDFVRDENLAVHGIFVASCFERLHMLEGFEQALIDLITEPETCREFFERSMDFRIETFHRMNEVYHYDYILFNDDWGTARGPFFSVDLMKETMLQPVARAVREIQKTGVKFIFHNCGLINDFIPYLVEDIKVDGLQIQMINDLKHIIGIYGDRVTPELQRPEVYKFFDPETTLEEVRAIARNLVDTYGAHVNPGAGCTYSLNVPTAEVYNAFEDEMYSYSLEKYKGSVK
jgi:uroporphyrinogen decarboxylase